MSRTSAAIFTNGADRKKLSFLNPFGMCHNVDEHSNLSTPTWCENRASCRQPKDEKNLSSPVACALALWRKF